MTPKSFAIVNLVLLAATSPWPFIMGSNTTIGGLPVWAIFTFVASAVYAVIISICLAHYWDKWAK
ncbi:hypothetical protein [Rubellicoccus peritrichatus]|uniref:Uncharacterized protein n=1 Tax=Rubellicoccus peritrichatus TaxID=3080537 RepID=A0AAQ3LAC0_9BACT|nr:hypothetical protein [Puniceicoccus sp. CR14]WOO42185.1 hypothetical protein RZN69_03725 [Puniceicoccus sp. CR14]